MSNLSLIECLPLEVLRNIATFCFPDEVVRTLPKVSKRFYAACHDSGPLRLMARCKLSEMLHRACEYSAMRGSIVDAGPYLEDGRPKQILVNPLVKRLDTGASASKDTADYWARWMMCFHDLENMAYRAGQNKDFSMLISAMNSLPHAMLLGTELPFFLPFAETPRLFLLELIAFYLFDVTGGPGFRSRLYGHGLDRQEINLRMAICMTVLIMEMANVDPLFERRWELGDQSVASWLVSAIIGGRDYKWLRNWPWGALALGNTSQQAFPRVDTFYTIMGITAAGRLYPPPSDVGPDSRPQPMLLPSPSRLPLFKNPYMTDCPVPFDIQIRPSSLSNGKNSAASTTSTVQRQERSFINILAHQQQDLLNTRQLFENGAWCGYYLPSAPYDLAECFISKLLHGIRFQAAPLPSDPDTLGTDKASSSSATRKWRLTSNRFHDSSLNVERCFNGVLCGDGEFATVELESQVSPTLTECWHGQVSPFGVSGGFSTRHVEGMRFSGGMFWLWREEWNPPGSVEGE